jgi:hypothetical protein
MAESAAASNAALLQLLAGLPKTLFGSSTSRTTTGGSVTEQTMFSKEAIDSLLRGIMEGTSGGVGLAQIASGQKSPGLYNSTARGMLMNDYSTRAAGVVAEKTAPKVTSRGGLTETTKIPGLMSKGTGLMLGAAALVGTKGGRKKLEEAYDFLSKQFGGGDISGVIDFADVAANPLAAFGNNSGAFTNLDTIGSMFPETALESFGSFAADDSWGVNARSIFDLTDTASAGVDAYSSMYDIYDAADAAQGLAFADGASSGFDIGGFSTAGLGSALRGDYADAATEAAIAAFVPGGSFLVAADNLLGTDITGQVGDKVFDDILGITDGKVICTELCRQGLMSKHLYIAEATANLKRLSATTLRGYHAIAVPVVHKMRKSAALSKFLQPWVLDYSNEILYGNGGLRGKFVRYILEPVCFVVGLVVSEQNYKELYANG